MVFINIKVNTMKSNLKENYKYYLISIFDYMERNGYTSKPMPKVVLINKEQSYNPFISTANYDPDKKQVNLYTKDRHIKDVLRSYAHELIHHKQNMEGRLGEGSYSGQEITEDEKLIKLEKEAYLNGNIAFRSWTEVMKKKKK